MKTNKVKKVAISLFVAYILMVVVGFSDMFLLSRKVEIQTQKDLAACLEKQNQPDLSHGKATRIPCGGYESWGTAGGFPFKFFCLGGCFGKNFDLVGFFLDILIFFFVVVFFKFVFYMFIRKKQIK
jgi:hypothetical protein